ncbi:MAG: YceI family protein [Cytophagales bacterium]|nr:YceI family protein [Cytophagales bacterium]
MSRLKLFILATLLSASSGFAQSGLMEEIFQLDRSHSYVNFSITYMGYAKVRGSFSDFNAAIRYDENDLSKTSVSFVLKVASIDTNNDWRDKDLQSPGWFDAEVFPTIQFTSTAANSEGNHLIVTGDLTIKDVTQSIELKMKKPLGVLKDNRDDLQVIFEGSYSLNRKAYHVMGKRWDQVKEGIASLSDEVTVEFSLLGKQIKAGNFSNWLRNPRSPQHHIYQAYNQGGTTQAIEQYQAMQDTMNVGHRALNMVGYMLVQENKAADAVVLLQRNAQDFPEQTNAFESLGEALTHANRIEEAHVVYQKALELDANNVIALEVLKHFQ